MSVNVYYRATIYRLEQGDDDPKRQAHVDD